LREPVRLIVPHDIAPGIYILRVALYNPRTDEALTAPPSEFVLENGQIKLTNVRVEK